MSMLSFGGDKWEEIRKDFFDDRPIGGMHSVDEEIIDNMKTEFDRMIEAGECIEDLTMEQLKRRSFETGGK